MIPGRAATAVNEVVGEMLTAFREAEELPDLNDADLFEAFAAHCVLHQFHEERFAPEAHLTGGGGDLKVDAWGIVVNGELFHDLDGVKNAVEGLREMNVVVVAVQAKRSTSAQGQVVADLADNLRQICSRGEITYTAAPEIRELHAALGVIYDQHHCNAIGSPRLEVRYVHCGPEANADLKEKCRSAERSLDELGRFESVRFEVVDFRGLRRLYQLTGRKVRVDFNWENRVPMPPMEGIRQAWTGTMPARDFVGDLLVDDGGSIRKFLFEDNVRPFLGEANEVNEGIAETLADPMRRKRFAVLNNGITVIARSFDTSGQECHMSDFQIVNGCQTGHVLFERRDLLTQDVHVKLTVIEPEPEVEGITSEITLATNRQNTVAKENLAADQTIHRDIEAYFETTKAPRNLYYERRSGQFDSNRSVTKTKVLKQSQLVQAYASVFGDHAFEATRPSVLLKNARLRIFHPDSEPIVYYTAASIWYQMEWLLRNNRVDRRWKPARYLLMAAVARRLTGGEPLPHHPRQARKYCEALLDRIWDREEVERLVGDMVPYLERLLGSDQTGQRLNDLARTKSFAERFMHAVGPD